RAGDGVHRRAQDLHPRQADRDHDRGHDPGDADGTRESLRCCAEACRGDRAIDATPEDDGALGACPGGRPTSASGGTDRLTPIALVSARFAQRRTKRCSDPSTPRTKPPSLAPAVSAPVVTASVVGLPIVRTTSVWMKPGSKPVTVPRARSTRTRS